VVSSALYVAHDGRLFVAFRAPHLYDAGRAQRLAGRGILRDVQKLAGHTSQAMTQRDIEGDTEAKRKLVALL
jgi:integrase